MYKYIVQVKGLEFLADEEKIEVNDLIARRAEKYNKLLDKINYLKISVQVLHQKSEGPTLYSIQTQLSIPGKTFESSSKAWDARTALMHALVRLESSIRKFKSRREEKRK
ncbi:MAG: hypothetical protein DRN65_07475 [Thaumarchaeota archaeon]|nr:MAG: hypothetical protein DRN65_07475 [Nitrososphaerota archaeon]